MVNGLNPGVSVVIDYRLGSRNVSHQQVFLKTPHPKDHAKPIDIHYHNVCIEFGTSLVRHLNQRRARVV